MGPKLIISILAIFVNMHENPNIDNVNNRGIYRLLILVSTVVEYEWVLFNISGSHYRGSRNEIIKTCHKHMEA